MVDLGHQDPRSHLFYGTYKMVQHALVTGSDIVQDWQGPPGGDGDLLESNKAYTFVLNCDAAAAARIKAGEREHVDDFWVAYEMIILGFTKFLQDIPPQQDEKALWAELARRSSNHQIFRGVKPRKPKEETDPQAWRSRLSLFFHALCSRSKVRDIGSKEDNWKESHTFSGFVVAWANGTPWKGKRKCGRDMMEHSFDIPANTVHAYLDRWPVEGTPPQPKDLISVKYAAETLAKKAMSEDNLMVLQ